MKELGRKVNTHIIHNREDMFNTVCKYVHIDILVHLQRQHHPRIRTSLFMVNTVRLELERYRTGVIAHETTR